MSVFLCFGFSIGSAVRNNRVYDLSCVHFRFWKSVAFCLFVALFVGDSCGRYVAALDFSIEEIRDSVHKYTQKIETLDGRMQIIFQTKAFKRVPSAPLVMEDLTIDTDFKVDLFHGRTFLATDRTWYYREISDSPFSVEHLDTFDGEAGYHLERTLKVSPVTSRLPLNFPYTLAVGVKDGTTVHRVISRLAGLPIPGAMVSLAAVLGSPEARITGKRTIDGHRCVDVSGGAGAWRVDASLDPSVSWLPRRLVAAYQSSTAPSTAPTFDLQTTEFGQFETGVPNDVVWFPVRGREIHMGATTVDLILNELRINTPMSKEQFKVDRTALPDGVRVETPSGTTYTGGREDLWVAMDKLVDEKTAVMQAIIEKSRGPATNNRPLPPMQAVTESGGGVMPTIVGISSVVLIVIGIWLGRKPS